MSLGREPREPLGIKGLMKETPQHKKPRTVVRPNGEKLLRAWDNPDGNNLEITMQDEGVGELDIGDPGTLNENGPHRLICLKAWCQLVNHWKV